jgi:hypothetical protein
MPTYKITELGLSRMDDDGKIWSIPEDPANSDYREYLASLDEASTL